MSGPRIFPLLAAGILGAKVFGGVTGFLPMTGVALGMFLTIAGVCIVAGAITSRVARNAERRRLAGR